MKKVSLILYSKTSQDSHPSGNAELAVLQISKKWYKPSWKPLKSGIVAIYTTKIDDFAHFRSFRRQIDVNWRQYVCYRNKCSSDTLTDCRNRYKPSWKPLKSGIVAIYTTKIDDFAHFRSFLTLRWRHYDVIMTSRWYLTQFLVPVLESSLNYL